MPTEATSPAINADERSFRTFKRGVMTSPVRNVSQRLCVDLPPQSVMGTETAGFAAYAELRRGKDRGNVGKGGQSPVFLTLQNHFKIERATVTFH